MLWSDVGRDLQLLWTTLEGAGPKKILGAGHKFSKQVGVFALVSAGVRWGRKEVSYTSSFILDEVS